MAEIGRGLVKFELIKNIQSRGASDSDMLGFVPYSAGAKRNLSGVMASFSVLGIGIAGND